MVKGEFRTRSRHGSAYICRSFLKNAILLIWKSAGKVFSRANGDDNHQEQQA